MNAIERNRKEFRTSSRKIHVFIEINSKSRNSAELRRKKINNLISIIYNRSLFQREHAKNDSIAISVILNL